MTKKSTQRFKYPSDEKSCSDFNWGVSSNWDTVLTAILFKWFNKFNHVFYTDIFCTFSNIGMYGLLYILTIHLKLLLGEI